MGTAGTLDPRAAAPSRPPRPALARQPRGLGGHPLGLALRRPLERFAPRLSPLPDLSSALPAVGSGRGLCRDRSSSGHRSASPWLGRLRRMVYRRYVRAGEKGGTCVGKTKRGKGTKLMAL